MFFVFMKCPHSYTNFTSFLIVLTKFLRKLYGINQISTNENESVGRCESQ